MDIRNTAVAICLTNGPEDGLEFPIMPMQLREVERQCGVFRVVVGNQLYEAAELWDRISRRLTLRYVGAAEMEDTLHCWT